MQSHPPREATIEVSHFKILCHICALSQWPTYRDSSPVLPTNSAFINYKINDYSL